MGSASPTIEVIKQQPKASMRNFETSTEVWKLILDSKNRFLESQVESPPDCPYLHPEIAHSWLRSRRLGVNPYKTEADKRVSTEEFARILKKNELLINITKSTFTNIKIKDIMTSKYALYIFDKNGVLLAHDGNMPQLSLGGNPLEGMIWTEETMGTCAHTLSMRLKRPVQLIGPEHYCMAFRNSCTSAAPVMDDNGEIIAVLVLSFHLEDLSPDNIFYLSTYPLGLITAMAVAVETKLRLTKNYELLEYAHHLQNVTLSVIDEGIIVVDNFGKFVHLNNQAAKILNINPLEFTDKNLKDYFSKRVLEAVTKGKTIDFEESINNAKEENSYLVCIRPIVNVNQALKGAVLKLTHIEKINAIVTSRSGAVATFTFDKIIGQSKAIKEVISLAKHFAASSENILLTGESGTGKELFAQAIHNAHRPHGPFIAVNCAAMPRELIESELFGYEGGSFTGAERAGRVGKIELANGGTLFLDEIGDMPVELQAVLLRVLEDKKVMRVGGRNYRKVNFRLICATNKNLQHFDNENLFRQDLYFRISTLNINLPPLREREKDIELLAYYFINKYCKKIKCSAPKIDRKALNILQNYSWPGNVRQLENAVIYAVSLSQCSEINPEHLPSFLFEKTPEKFSSFTSFTGREVTNEIYNIDVMERILIENVLYKTKNNITKSAEMLGIAKSTLYRKLKELKIKIE